MARAKKEAALTPEERLQAALVPDWEWPYKLPENWCWTYVSTAYDVTSSKRVHKEDWLSEGIPFYRTRELVKLSSNGFVDNELYISEEQYETFKREYGVPAVGDLLISGVGTIGVPYVIESHEKFYFKDGNVIWFKNRGLFIPRFIFYLYKSMFMDKQIHDMASGTTVDTYTIINANMTKVPLAPLSEQQRIVDRIESLFAKLDEAKEKAQAVVDSFETRKAAILHKAFTGELTAKWREKHGVGMESWKTTVLSDVGEVITGSTPDTKHPEFYGGDIPFIKPTELNQGRHVVYSADTLTEEGKNVSRPIRAGTTCICCIGATISKCGFIEVDAVTNQQINSVVPYSFMDDIYVYYYCCSTDFKNELISNASATTLPIINKKKTSLLNITYPEKPEQTEIVRILDDLFAKEQQAKDAAEAVLEKIDLMKKAILARAFRGELGTNDPNDEPAVELLKKIL